MSDLQLIKAMGPIYTARQLFREGQRDTDGNPFDVGSQQSVDYIVEMNRLSLEEAKEESMRP